MHKPTLRRLGRSLFLAALACPAAADSPPLPATPPAWLHAHIESMTADGGRWITDNAAYRSDEEPWEAYGTEWRWGVGRKSMLGRLYGIAGGEEMTTFWEYRLVWHPGERAVLLYQFGVGGSFGVGPVTVRESGVEEAEQTFYELDGTVWKLRHETHVAGGERRSNTFREVGGRWQDGRSYTWRRAP